MNKLTKKYIFKQKLKGKPVEVHEAFIDWDLLEECGLLKIRHTTVTGFTSYVARYTIIFRKNISDSDLTMIKYILYPGDIYRI